MRDVVRCVFVPRSPLARQEFEDIILCGLYRAFQGFFEMRDVRRVFVSRSPLARREFEDMIICVLYRAFQGPLEMRDT